MLSSDFTLSSPRSDLDEPCAPRQAEDLAREPVLFDAITAHDRSAIKTILAQPRVAECGGTLDDLSLDLSILNQDGQTPLHVAADLGDADTIVDLIQFHREDPTILRCEGDDWQARICFATNTGKRNERVNDFKFLDAQDRNGFSPLMLAAKKGHIAAVQVLLDAGADVNDMSVQIEAAHKELTDCFAGLPVTLHHPDRSRFTQTVLILAVENGHLMVVTQLLSAGARHTPHRPIPDQSPDSIARSYTPLMITAKMGDIAMAKTLVGAGARPGFESVGAIETPLIVASKYDQVEMIHYLIDAGVDVNHKPPRGHAPLTIAAQAGCVDAIKALCSRGATINPTSNSDLTPLQQAAKHGQVPAIEALLDLEADINAVDKRGRSPLIHAVEAQHPAAVTTLINRGALDCVPPHKRPEVWVHAAKHNSVELIKALLKMGVGINQANNVGMTPLLIVTKLGHLPAMQTLLQTGADIEARGINRYTPMAMAALSNQVGAIRLLHANQANLEARTAQQPLPPNMPLTTPHLSGKTPLLLAAEAGHLDSVETLIELDADIDARDNHGSTALTLAVEHGHTEVIAILVKKGANLELRNADKDTPFMIAAKERDHDLMVRLHAAGANINAVDINVSLSAGNSPLHTAIEMGDMETLLLLLQLEADMDQENAAGFSPVRVAIEYNRPEMIHALLVSGADIDTPDRNGTTPFMAASRLNQVDTMRWLAQAHANTRATNAGGQDARTLAIRAGAHEAHEFLVKELGWITPTAHAPRRPL